MEIILSESEIKDIVKNAFNGVNVVKFNYNKISRDEFNITATLEVDSKKYSSIPVKTGIVVKPNLLTTTDEIPILPERKKEEEVRKGLMISGGGDRSIIHVG